MLWLGKQGWTVGCYCRLVPFPSMKTAYKYIERMVKSGLLVNCGPIRMKARMGAPLILWGTERTPKTWALHNWMTSRSVEPYLLEGIEVLRNGELDKRLDPDATLLFGDKKIHWEMERTQKSESNFQRRIRKYVGCPDIVMWIVPDEKQKKWIMERIGAISEMAFVTTIKEIKSDPWGYVFEDTAGQRVSLKELL